MEQRAAAGTIGLHDACDEYGPADRDHLVTFGMSRGGLGGRAPQAARAPGRAAAAGSRRRR